MIILNEKEYAEECLRTNSYGESIYITLQILAKYYYYVHGFRAKRIEHALIDFLSNNYPGYSASKRQWADTVERLSRHAGKYDLYEDSEIWITKTELDRIESISVPAWKDIDLRRIAFTFLCLAKLNNRRNPKNNNWVNTAVNDVFAMAHVNANKIDKYKMLGALDHISILCPAKKNENLSSQVLIVDSEGEGILPVSDFRDLGYEYSKYTGENYIRCANCGRLVRGNKAGTKKYCSECAGYRPIDFRAVICTDCGIEFNVAASNKRSTRCPSCYALYRREQKNKSDRKVKENRTVLF